MPRGRRADLVGHRKGSFVVTARLGPDQRRNIVWKALCDCGRTFTLPTSAIVGSQVSCGCRQYQPNPDSYCGTPEHTAWAAMKQRCGYQGATSYPNYGGRGIRVAPEWVNDFAAFLAHVGKKPSPAHTLDRIDPCRDYEPGNVRWATRLEQGRNTRTNHLVTHAGETMSISAWAERTGINDGTIWTRLVTLGWPPAKALTAPVRSRPKRFRRLPDGGRIPLQTIEANHG
jgi:hypothetical protein